MIAGIVRNSIKYAGVVVALAITIVSYGLYTISNANLDVFPEFSPSQVVLQIEAPGYSSALVEKLVTQPIENALMGIPELENIRSQSIPGLSVVTVIFKDGSDVYLNRQVVGERISALGSEMPRGVSAPTMTPLTSSASTVLGIGVTSDKRSFADLRTLVDWTIRPHLLGVPGVAEVNVFGGDVRQWQIQVDLQKLEQSDVSFQDLLKAAQSVTGMVGTGFITTPNQHLNIQLDGQPRDLRDIEYLIVESRTGAKIRLGDLAKIVTAPAPSIGAASIDAKEGVFLMIQGQLGANTYAVTQDLERAISELAPLIEREEVTLHENLFRPANFIETAVKNVQRDVLIGSALVISIFVLISL